MTPVQKRKVGIDSNCLSYLIDAMHGVGADEPVGGQIASQKKALLRAFLYDRRYSLFGQLTLFIIPGPWMLELIIFESSLK